MFESELNTQTESIETIPIEILRRFGEYRSSIEARTVLPWGEHCTECLAPSCYTTCELYETRSDGGCRQFVKGVVRIAYPQGTPPYLQKITFRRWAKLWTWGSLSFYSVFRADLMERLNIIAGNALRKMSLPAVAKHKVLQKIAYIRRKLLTKSRAGMRFVPDFLVAEIYNPNPRQVEFTLSVRVTGKDLGRAYQRLLVVDPGFKRDRIPIAEMAAIVNRDVRFEVELVPNDAENLTFYFGLLDFVKEKSQSEIVQRAQSEPRKCKAIIWDIDNTLWEGVLVEDGPEKLRLKDGIRETVRALDARGILQSIASKNNDAEAMPVLRKFGIAEYFLFPQINWKRKSSSVAAIASALNVGLDSLIFVDDQEFERREVKNAFPEITVLDAVQIAGILHRPECQVPITEESKTRRLMYVQEKERVYLLEDYGADYLGFLKRCRIRLVVTSLHEGNLQRVYELAQRTNQLNFSGNRYSAAELRGIMSAPFLQTHVMKCSDSFGSYGIVGFGVVNGEEGRLVDLMFSCRVQGKRIEHAFLCYLLRQYSVDPGNDFYANLHRTSRNGPSSAVFGEIGFEEVDVQNGTTILRFPKGKAVPDDGIVAISTEA